MSACVSDDESTCSKAKAAWQGSAPSYPWASSLTATRPPIFYSILPASRCWR